MISRSLIRLILYSLIILLFSQPSQADLVANPVREVPSFCDIYENGILMIRCPDQYFLLVTSKAITFTFSVTDQTSYRNAAGLLLHVNDTKYTGRIGLTYALSNGSGLQWYEAYLDNDGKMVVSTLFFISNTSNTLDPNAISMMTRFNDYALVQLSNGSIYTQRLAVNGNGSGFVGTPKTWGSASLKFAGYYQQSSSWYLLALVDYPGAMQLEQYKMSFASSSGVTYSKQSSTAIITKTIAIDQMKIGTSVVVLSCPTCESLKGQLYVYALDDLQQITVETGGLIDQTKNYKIGTNFDLYTDDWGVEQIYYDASEDTLNRSNLYISLLRVFKDPTTGVWYSSNFRDIQKVLYNTIELNGLQLWVAPNYVTTRTDPFGMVLSALQCQRNHYMYGNICEPCPESAPYSLGIDKTSCTPCSVVSEYVNTDFQYPYLVYNQTCLDSQGNLDTSNEDEDIDLSQYENPIDETVGGAVVCYECEIKTDNTGQILIIILVVAFILICVGVTIWWIIRRKRKNKKFSTVRMLEPQDEPSEKLPQQQPQEDPNSSERAPIIEMTPRNDKAHDYRTDEHRIEHVTILPAIKGSSIAINTEHSLEDYQKKELMPKIEAPDAATFLSGNNTDNQDGPSDQ